MFSPRKFVILDDAVLKKLAKNQEALSLLPELHALLGGGCGGCPKRGPSRVDMNALKASISLSSKEVLQKVKDILKTPSLRIIYKDGNSVVNISA